MSSAVPAGDGPDNAAGSTGLDSPSGSSHRAQPPIHEPARRSSREVVKEQKAQFGGMKFGACFFGWLTATGLTLLVASLLSAVGLGVGQTVQPGEVTGDAQTFGIGAAIVLLFVIFLGYYAGGYVAGRMARFNGVKQGVGVWLWAVIIAVVLAVLGLIAGAQFDVLSRLQALPQVPVDDRTLTTGGVISALAVAVGGLVAAILGGLTGMRYHRKIDRVADEL
jgi:putative exporter of polyketide antibiotics